MEDDTITLKDAKRFLKKNPWVIKVFTILILILGIYFIFYYSYLMGMEGVCERSEGKLVTSAGVFQAQCQVAFDLDVYLEENMRYVQPTEAKSIG